jgi:hypothetical protein
MAFESIETALQQRGTGLWRFDRTANTKRPGKRPPRGIFRACSCPENPDEQLADLRPPAGSG